MYIPMSPSSVCAATHSRHVPPVKEISTEICSACHPFFTGKQKLMDTAGRVERFKKRYGQI